MLLEAGVAVAAYKFTALKTSLSPIQSKWQLLLLSESRKERREAKHGIWEKDVSYYKAEYFKKDYATDSKNINYVK